MVPHEDMLLTIAATAALLLFVQRLAHVADEAWLGRLGWRPLLATTGWLGVPVHEGAHALACVLTRRKIRELRLLAPDRQTGVLGYVLWEPGQGPGAWLAELIVGVAPLAASLGAMATLAWLEGGHWPMLWGQAHAVHAESVWQELQALGNVTVDHVAAGGWTRTATLLRLYAMVAIAAHGVPSRTDLAGTWRGLGLLIVVALGLFGLGRLVDLPIGLTLLQTTAQLCGALLPALALALVAVSARWAFASWLPLPR